MKRKLFDKPTSYAILAFILAAAMMLAYCESVDAAEVAVEEQHDSNAGSTPINGGLDRLCGRYTYDTGTAMYFCPLVAVRGDIKGDSFEFGLTDELWPRWEGELRLNRFDGDMNGGFGLRRVIGDGPFQLFLGGSYWINQSPGSDSHFTFNLGLRYTL